MEADPDSVFTLRPIAGKGARPTARLSVSALACAALCVLCGGADVRAAGALPYVEPSRFVPGADTLRVWTPAGRILPTLDMRVGYNQHLRRLVFEFFVGNERRANNSIAGFAIDSLSRPFGVRSPSQWLAMYGVYGDKRSVVWVCLDTLTTPRTPWKGGLYRSPFLIDPGDTLHRFQVFTEERVTRIHFYAFGYDTFPGPHDRLVNPLKSQWRGEIDLDEAELRDLARPKPRGEARLVEMSAPSSRRSPGRAMIGYVLPRGADVEITVLDARGATVRRLVGGGREAGLHVTLWNGRDPEGRPCAPGAYTLRLEIGGREIARRRVVVLE